MEGIIFSQEAGPVEYEAQYQDPGKINLTDFAKSAKHRNCFIAYILYFT